MWKSLQSAKLTKIPAAEAQLHALGRSLRGGQRKDAGRMIEQKSQGQPHESEAAESARAKGLPPSGLELMHIQLDRCSRT